MLDRIEDTLEDQPSTERRDIVLHFNSLALQDISVRVEIGTFESVPAQQLHVTIRDVDRPEGQVRADPSYRHAAIQLDELKKKAQRFGNTLKYKATLTCLEAYLGKVENVRKLADEVVDGPALSQLAWRSTKAEALLNCDALDEAFSIASSDESRGDVRSCLVAANVHIKRSEFGLAKQAVQAALEIDYLDYHARLAAAALLLHEGDLLPALRSFKVAQELQPTAFIPKIYSALVYLKLGQEASAIKLLNKVVHLHPLEDSALSLLADVLLRDSGKTCASQAARHLARFKALFPSRVTESLEDRLAVSLLCANETRSALKILTEQYRRRSEHVPTVNNLGVVALRLGRPRDAAKFFEEAAAKAAQRHGLSHPDLISYANFLGSLIKDGELDRAVRFADSILEAFALDQELPRDVAPILLRKLEALSDLERSEEAIAIVRTLLERAKPTSETWFQLALFFLYELAFELNSQEEVLSIARQLMSKALAERTLSTSLRRRAVNNAVVAMILADRSDEARNGLSYLSAFAQSESYAAATFGLFAIWSGDLTLGIKRYELAVALAEHKTLKARIRQRMNLEVGRSYLKRGEMTRAIRALRKATETKDTRVRVTQEASRLLLLAQQASV